MTYKHDFPIFSHHSSLVYLDSASTTQKPSVVINAEKEFYETSNANVHRGVYRLSEHATAAYEGAREKTRKFINAKQSHEIIFTRGTTEAINLVAQCFGDLHIQRGDEIILSTMEHHSNIVPWQQLCERVGCVLKIISLNALGELDMGAFQSAINEKTKFISIIHVSNVLGTINPVKEIISLAHQKNIPVLLDGAQAIGHIPIDVQALNCDFYVFSSHKCYGPTGVGVLYGKSNFLEQMPPYQFGGDMIRRVTFEKTEFNVLPYKFEAGTPNIAGVVGLGAAIDYIRAIGFEKIQLYENELCAAATNAMKSIDGLTIVGTSPHKLGVISFVMNAAHPHDIATILDQSCVAVRAGHHCAMPLMDYLKVPALTRMSLGIYNDASDIDALMQGLKNVRKIFGKGLRIF